MRTKLIQVLYRLTAFLADKTKGFSLFSKWKIALGSLLVSVTITSFSCSRGTTCYDPIEPNESPKDTTEQVTCYDVAEPIDTTKINAEQ